MEFGRDCLARDSPRATKPLDGGDEFSVEFTTCRLRLIVASLTGSRGCQSHRVDGAHGVVGREGPRGRGRRVGQMPRL